MRNFIALADVAATVEVTPDSTVPKSSGASATTATPI
jgi:hypothetical protein